MIKLLWSGILMLLLVSGCGWNGTPTRVNDFTPLTSITISADLSTIAKHTSTKLKATGNFSGLFTRDITDQVTWSSDTATVALFSTPTSPNRVTGVAPGTATITATMGSISAPFTLVVSSASISTMAITPVAPSIPVGKSQQFLVTGTFSDASTQDITFDATWASSDLTVATIDTTANKGLAQAVAVGPATISATFDGVSGSTVMAVTIPVLQSITVTPANPSVLSLSTSGSFTATGHYSDGSTPDITDQVIWASSNPAIATIATTGGAATTLSQGTTSIIATPLPSVPSNPGVTGTSVLKVTGGTLNSFTVSPVTVILVKDTTVRMKATGTFSNGSTRDITGAVKWKAVDTSLATVTTPVGNLVWLNALATTGATSITATSGSLIPFPTTLTVIAPQLLSITIFTNSPELTAGSLTAGTSARFTVTANFNGTTQDVTTLTNWTSDNPAIATVGTSGLAAGRVTGIAAGSTTIRATYTNNGITAPVQVQIVTVRSRSLQSLTISPLNSPVQAGNQVQFTATANYSDGTKDVTEDTAWAIGNPNVAILADNASQPGQIVGVDSGSTTVTAKFGGQTLTTNVNVTGP